MKHKLLIGFAALNIFIFSVPAVLSNFIELPQNSQNVFSQPQDKQENASEPLTISVLDTKNGNTHDYNLEEYLVGVVSAEMPASYELEALKAQAVAARSYIISKMGTENPVHPEAVVCNDSSHCKAYLSLDEAKEKWGDAWETDYYPKVKKAVTDTAGEYLAYDNQAVEAFFFALSNGETESSAEVWGGDLPYLKSTESEMDRSSPDFYADAEFKVADFNEKLKALNPSYAPSENISVSNITYTEGGRVKNIDINGTTFSGTDIRSCFSLNSADFTIEQNGGNIIFHTEGKGHGVGMSQYGANTLAKEGYTYEEILKHYYNGVEIITKL